MVAMMEGEGRGENEGSEEKELFLEGKRAYLIGNYAEAADMLSEACGAFTELYGQYAVECFDAHFYYGKTLLELARLEPGVFSNALTGVNGDLVESDSDSDEEQDIEKESSSSAIAEKESSSSAVAEKESSSSAVAEEQFEQLTDAERDEIRQEVNQALEENAQSLQAVAAGDSVIAEKEENGQPCSIDDLKEKTTTGNEEEEEDGVETATGIDNADIEGAEHGTEEEEEQNQDESVATHEQTNVDDIPNLQLAWEVLEVARGICDRQEGDEWQKKKIAVLLTLGDVCIEDENYKQAIDDLTLCLDMQKNLLPAYDRRIAECYFQLGQAFKLSDDFPKAAANYTRAMEVLKDRQEYVKSELVKAMSEESKTELMKELTDLDDLIPDVQSRVVDAQESAVQFDATKIAAESAKPVLSMGQSDAPARDISALVRKPVKRTADMETEGTKRIKTDDNDSTTATTSE